MGGSFKFFLSHKKNIKLPPRPPFLETNIQGGLIFFKKEYNTPLITPHKKRIKDHSDPRIVYRQLEDIKKPLPDGERRWEMGKDKKISGLICFFSACFSSSIALAGPVLQGQALSCRLSPTLAKPPASCFLALRSKQKACKFKKRKWFRWQCN